MKIKILKKYYYENEIEGTTIKEYQGIVLFAIISKIFKFKIFTDCGNWFVCLCLKNKMLKIVNGKIRYYILQEHKTKKNKDN